MSRPGDITLAVLLRRARLAVGLTLREVATSTGLSNPYISQLENGHVRNPTVLAAAKLARCYGISVNEIVDAAERSEVAANT